MRTASAKANRAATIGRVHGNGDPRYKHFVTDHRRIDLSTRVDLSFDVYVLVGLVRDVSFAYPLRAVNLEPY
jgi:hypothetical protein